jgi:hypothetical protein
VRGANSGVVFISSMSNTTILIHGERGKAWRSEAGPSPVFWSG